MVRKSAPWMCTLDERILEYLRRDLLGTADWISGEMKMNASERRVRERLGMLADAGLVAPLTEDGDLWVLTMTGIEYLDGELDAENQPRPSPRRAGG
jgi:hypothetical protein